MNTEQLIQNTLEAHRADKTEFDHLQTTITSIIGILQSVHRNLNDPEIVRAVITAGY